MLFVSQRYISLPPPDWKYSDLVQAFFCSLMRKEPSTKSLETTIKQILGLSQVMVTNLGRTALTIGLKALGLEKGSGVILPTVVCPTVIRAILKADCYPILVDVEKNLHVSVRILNRYQLEHAHAIVVPHLYGLSAPIQELLEWAQERGLYIIDDAAQAFGLSTNGKKLGTFGDLGVLSFGPFKSLGTPRGGALISVHEDVIPTAENYDLPQESLFEALQRIISGVIKFHWRPLFLKFQSKFNPQKIQTRFKISTDDQRPDEMLRLSNLEACLVQMVLPRTDIIIARRQETAERVWNVLRQFEQFEYVGPNNVPYIKIPIRVHGGLTADEAVNSLRSMQIEAGRIYRPLHLYANYKGYAHHLLPIAEESWGKVFLIPNPVSTGYSELNRLTEAFKVLSSN